MKGREALELGTLSCLMICFTASNKFKNMHQHITDKESVDAEAGACRFTLGSHPVTQPPLTNRREERVAKRRWQRGLLEGPRMKLKASRSPSTASSWAHSCRLMAVRTPPLFRHQRRRLYYRPALVSTRERGLCGVHHQGWPSWTGTLWKLDALCFPYYPASEAYISERRWAECLIFTSFHPSSSHLHAAIKESSLVCIVL